jgi:hypothetical protein
MITIQDAVVSLRPNAEWTMDGDDVENMTWHTPNVEPLTTVEVQAEVARLESEESAKEAAAAQAIADAIAHAKTLGFTDEMINVMYPSLGVVNV